MATETWLLNETVIDELGDRSNPIVIDFVSNGTNYVSLFDERRCLYYNMASGQQILVYDDNSIGWNNEAYRTITFAKPPTGDLLTWLQANGTKQQPTYTFKHWKKSNVKVNRTLVGQKYYYFKPYTILGLYTITTTLTNCTGASANATKIQENGDLTLTFTANSGYDLPTGVSVTNVTSYNWNKSTGVLAISKPTGDVTIEIVAVSALPQLSTPTNVAVSGTTVSWDAVENATSYAVLADGNEIGTVENQTGYNVSVQNVSQHSKAAPFNVGFGYDNGTNIQYDGFPSFISSGSSNAVVSLNTKDYANSNGLVPNIIVVGVYQAIIAVVENVNTTGGATFVRYGDPSEYPYSEFAYNTIAIYKIEDNGAISINGYDND